MRRFAAFLVAACALLCALPRATQADFFGPNQTLVPSSFAPVSAVFTPKSIPGLILWLRSDMGVTGVMSAVTASGTAPPTVTLSGTPNVAVLTNVEIDISTTGTLGTATFQWKQNGSVQQTGQTTAATFALGSTGLTANFSVGAYTNNDVYTALVQVSAWADQSGSGNNTTQSTGSNQPAYHSSGGGSSGLVPYIQFTAGTSQVLAGAVTLPISSPLTAETFHAGRVTALNASSNSAIFSNGNNRYSVVWGGGSQVSPFMLSAGPVVGNSCPGISINTDIGADAVWTGASAKLACNGGSFNSGTSMTGAASTFAVGNNNTAGTTSIGGWIYEELFYNVPLTTSQETQVNNYFFSRYGVQ
jgi:hypothetical protein